MDGWRFYIVWPNQEDVGATKPTSVAVGNVNDERQSI